MKEQMIAIEGIQMPDNCHQCDAIGISDLVGIKCPCIKNEDSYDFKNRPNGCPLKMVREIKRKGETKTFNCKFCGKSFSYQNKGGRDSSFCSEKCRKQQHNKTRRDKRKVNSARAKLIK